MSEPSPQRPVYRKEPDPILQNHATSLFMVTVDEGWRKSILGGNMYEWAADWLVEELQGKPFAPGRRS